LIESFIDLHLKTRLEWFNMQEFMEMLKLKSEFEGEIFDLLDTLADFDSFKNLILDYKDEKQGRALDLSGLLTVVSKK
jgi:ADP-ribosylation factor 2-binding protein